MLLHKAHQEFLTMSQLLLHGSLDLDCLLFPLWLNDVFENDFLDSLVISVFHQLLPDLILLLQVFEAVFEGANLRLLLLELIILL